MNHGIVTTCGVTSIKESPGDARVPISAAKLADEEMDGHLESTGATDFFTLVRYNMPELLDDYIAEKKVKEEAEAAIKLKEEVLCSEGGNLKKQKLLSSINSSVESLLSKSGITSDTKGEETAEDIIFMLFGPRVWQHQGKVLFLSLRCRSIISNFKSLVGVGLRQKLDSVNFSCWMPQHAGIIPGGTVGSTA